MDGAFESTTTERLLEHKLFVCKEYGKKSHIKKLVWTNIQMAFRWQPKLIPESQPIGQLYKLTPLWNELQKQFEEIRIPGQNIGINESMVSFRGCQYIKK